MAGAPTPTCTGRVKYGSQAQAPIPQPQVSPSDDGPYTILARSSATDASAPALPPLSSDAVATILVDRTPPSLNITQRPQPVQSDPAVTVRFGTDPPGDAASYVCRWGQGKPGGWAKASMNFKTARQTWIGYHNVRYWDRLSSGFDHCRPLKLPNANGPERFPDILTSQQALESASPIKGSHV